MNLKIFYLLLLIYFIKPSLEINNYRHGLSPETLFVDSSDDENVARKPKLIVIPNNNIDNNINANFNFLSNVKTNNKIKNIVKRSASATDDNQSKKNLSNKDYGGVVVGQNISTSNGATLAPTVLNQNLYEFATNNKNISVQMNRLNDSHAQLMVHWLGEGTNVMICLAREPPPAVGDTLKTTPTPSSVFISYDYGDTFEDKSSNFVLNINGTNVSATLDQFTTHPKYNTIVFTDVRNKAIFTSNDYGKTIIASQLDFRPSDVSFYESDGKTFLVLDKEDPERKLYYTNDFGATFTLLQSFVKSFVWSSGEGFTTHLYVERSEPTNSSSVIFMNASELLKASKPKFNTVIENVQDFNIKKEFMFATRKILNNTQLLISYRRGTFIKAEFQTELDIKGMHIVDVEGKRIMVSAIHAETVSYLYVSESDNEMTEIKFVLSLENIFTYIPELTWQSSWLVHSSDETFTDLYKVEGLRGIYIASKHTRPPGAKFISITPEYLVSVITFDHGATWNPITAPTVDDEGQMINCTRDCSLHLSQKFNQLYPVTRSVTIMSSKSAPGVIMATGVIGKSLKGHPGVFISRDAGVTWKQILKSYHFFNFGDHGGILVAVKYFKSKGETQEILYSTDEGEKWNSYSFHSKKLKVYGFMTEPNTNSTIFTLFGSEPEEHKWLIVKLDLKNAFSHNCTEDDYKFWAPGSANGGTIPCLLGVQTTYQRRIPHANCYNGLDYVRPIKTKVCQCSVWDFECDFGFSRLNHKSECIRNKSSTYNPYEIPVSCQPGIMYKRTKGYRKIEGDVCENGMSTQYLPQPVPCPIREVGEFLIVAQRESISRINLLNNKRETLPVQNLRNVIAIDFDLKNNCVFWADIMADVIGRQCLNGTSAPEIIIDTDLASVEGMSYDWVSQMLFFVDGIRIKIEAVKTSPENLGMRTVIVQTKHLSKPRGIVVHPLQGYIFWTDWSSSKPSLSRANMDGTNIQVLFTKPYVVWPNGVTIDYIAERVYWVDASKDYIASCDLHGKLFKKVIEQDGRVSHPFAVAVFKDLMYWDDWRANSIFSADKDQGIMTKIVASEMTTLMDLKIYAHSIQEGTNGCSGDKKCSHICVGAPLKGYSCLCPDGMEKSNVTGECLCPGGLKPYSNKTCPQQANTCATGFFTCNNKLCVPMLYRCDSEDDCGDNSDEENCSSMKPPCPPRMFTCKSDHKCIPEYFHCDHDKDCADGSDEIACSFNQCNQTEFACANGRCISKIWVCDGEDDCRDGSDEKNCTKEVSIITCRTGEFKCASSGTCISEDWRCDGDFDCPDQSDENDCKLNHSCEPWQFSCGDGACIYNTWVCDGDSDCSNGLDEKNCSRPTVAPPDVSFTNKGTCYDWMIKCSNTKCIPYWWKCDGVNDCGDGSDELGCAGSSKSTTTTERPMKPLTPNITKCDVTQFRCDSGICIAKRYVCDGLMDCSKGEDEDNCLNDRRNCGYGKFRCRSDSLCLPREKYCDKVVNCVDGSDEEDCELHPSNKPKPALTCRSGYFGCDNICIALMKVCDGKNDCYDGNDERNCNETQRIYQVTHIGVDERTTNETSFLIFWWIPVPQNIIFEYLPSKSILDSNIWENHTSWIEGTEHRFYNLNPFTNYNVTVYVRIQGNGTVFPPYLYSNITTSEGVPSAPDDLQVLQVNGSRVRVSWTKPKEVFGNLVSYNIYYTKESKDSNKVEQPTVIKVSPSETSYIIDSFGDTYSTYKFWIKAKNGKYESPSSKLVRLLFDDVKNIDSLNGLKIVSNTADGVVLSWNPIVGADGYLVQPVLPQAYPKVESVSTRNSTVILKNLVPGVQYIVKVLAFAKNYYGRPSTAVFTRDGESLPIVEGASVFQDEAEVKFRWSAVSTKFEDEITYGVYYGTTLDELFEKPRLETKESHAEFIDLLPCESYIFAVGIVKPIGPGPIGSKPKVVETIQNLNKPPRNVKVQVDEEKHEMVLTWEHNCPLATVYPGYTISVKELTHNQTSIYKLNSSRSKILSHTFVNIPDGARYEVNISTNSGKAQAATVFCDGVPLPPPTNVNIWPEKNGSFVIYWKVMEHLDNGFTYEAVAYNGTIRNFTNISPVVILTSKTPPILMHPNHLGGSDAAGKYFTIGVRLKSSDGYVSDIKELEFIEVQPDAAWLTSVLPSSTSSWLFILPVLLIGVIASITYLIQRQRRIQNSFSRFANSHYDTKTGATRIGDTLEEDEHQETTSTRFADDEPLVIA